MSTMTSDVTLFGGIDDAVHAALKLIPYHTKSAYLSLRKTAFEPTVWERMALDAFAAARKNFDGVLSNPNRVHSSQNWRLFMPQTVLAARNQSAEVVLERRIARACISAGRRDWWNQVPVASGLVSASSGKKRAIDLVRHRGGQAYDFVELKVASNTPLYAAVEILEYGFVWLLSKQNRERLGFSVPSLLDADDVALCVLAPEGFYCDLDLSNLESGINAALATIGRAYEVELSFRFEQFPKAFDPNPAAGYDDSALLEFVDRRSARCS